MFGQHPLALPLIEALSRQKLMVTTVESCTGGLLAKLLTDVPGSSAVFGCGFVTYSNCAKQNLVGVSEATLAEHGAVSAETVREMAVGGLRKANAQLAIAVSGIAGPDGGTQTKPVGLVWFAIARAGESSEVVKKQFAGNREEIREAAATVALTLLLQATRTALPDSST